MKTKGKSFSAMAALGGACLSLVATVAFLVYGLTYSEYFDATVLICLLLGAAAMAAYAMVNKPITEFLNLVGVFADSFGLGLFFLNSYPVWADWYGNFDMYGSRGGVGPVIAILAITVLGILCGIVSCFVSKGGDEQ